MTENETGLKRRDVMKRASVGTGALVGGGIALGGTAAAQTIGAECKVILQPVDVDRKCEDVEPTGGAIQATATLESGNTCEDITDDIVRVREVSRNCEVCKSQRNRGDTKTYRVSSGCAASPERDDIEFLCVAGETLFEGNQRYRVNAANECRAQSSGRR